jgi:predicted oxidoreductase
MKTYPVPHTDLVVSRIAYGCGMLGGWDKGPVSADTIENAVRVIHTASEQGITLFDHADVYGFGKAETVFGEVLKRSPGLRDKIVIQSKCGQRFRGEPQASYPNRMDSSRAHIVRCVEGSLKRLGTDHLDLLLLHLADALLWPQEVAKAFDELEQSGKVRYFGVSNHTAGQIALLRKHVRQPLVVNQIQLGLAHSYAIADGLERTLEFTQQDLTRQAQEATQGKVKVNTTFHRVYTGLAGTGTLDYCRLHDIQIQAYSPLRGELLKPSADATPEVKHAAQVLAELAKEKNTTPSALALAWLLAHPAGIVPVIGAMNPAHLIDNCKADRVELSREEWYALFTAAAEIRSRAL